MCVYVALCVYITHNIHVYTCTLVIRNIDVTNQYRDTSVGLCVYITHNIHVYTCTISDTQY